MSIRSHTVQFGAVALTNLTCLWTATQWSAHMLGYQPALGEPLLAVLGLPVYAPWKLFPWWLSFDAQAPNEMVHREEHRSGGERPT